MLSRNIVPCLVWYDFGSHGLDTAIYKVLTDIPFVKRQTPHDALMNVAFLLVNYCSSHYSYTSCLLQIL